MERGTGTTQQQPNHTSEVKGFYLHQTIVYILIKFKQLTSRAKLQAAKLRAAKRVLEIRLKWALSARSYFIAQNASRGVEIVEFVPTDLGSIPRLDPSTMNLIAESRHGLVRCCCVNI